MKKIIGPSSAAPGTSGENTENTENTERTESTKITDRRHAIPPEIFEITRSALQVGGLFGVSGVLVGGVSGILRSAPSVVVALAAGIQWFTVGTTFTASREAVLRTWRQDEITPQDKIYASAISGGIAGTFGGMLRGPRNIIPGAITYALFGTGGQYLYNRVDAQNTKLIESGKALKKTSWLDSKWVPMKRLTDEEHEHIISEKLLSVNAEIALLDENIEALRAQEREFARKESGNSKSES